MELSSLCLHFVVLQLITVGSSSLGSERRWNSTTRMMSLGLPHKTPDRAIYANSPLRNRARGTAMGKHDIFYLVDTEPDD